ncbi:hypothetical protein ABT56_11015 [Photobacterium aquae]|uniref:Uncharacterized protein n=1 Tax=Photobacterium aquae TaxID=1195763 RepID=A0A0J1H0Z7_9GAMM|nr:hypothetical protein [Photobacterium aquae]KLV05498.1 hypothetical protein ABT56_11015 [Photobacterium aquae]
MTNQNSILGGFIIVKVNPDSSGLKHYVSVSADICPQFPGVAGFWWNDYTNRKQEDYLINTGIPIARYTEIKEWAQCAFEIKFGWVSIFYALSDAKEAKRRFFRNDPSIRIIAIGFSAQDSIDLLDGWTPDSNKPIIGERALLKMLFLGNNIPEKWPTLGYEVVECSSGMLGESWMIQDGLIEKCAIATGQVIPETGLCETFESAELCRKYIEKSGIADEEGPWFSIQLVDCT